MTSSAPPSSMPDYLFKVVVVGESGVGKTNLVKRYVHSTFDESFNPTIAVECESISISSEGKTSEINFWDTAGQDKLRTITRTYYKEAHGAVIVYDIADKESFLRIPYWVKEIKEYCFQNVQIILLGNKKDKLNERKVNSEEAAEFAKKNGFFFMEVSAKTNEENCVFKAMGELNKEMMAAVTPESEKLMKSKLAMKRNTKLMIESSKDPKKGGCCLKAV